MPIKSKKTSLSNVDAWLKRETPHVREALENASRHFDERDSLTGNTLEAIYAQESSFGKKRGKRGVPGAAGDFQLERRTAKRMGLVVSEKNDQRFDIDNASAAAAKYLKTLEDSFSRPTPLEGELKTNPISDPIERKKFALAAYNAGEGRIAKAQENAKQAAKDPANWEDVKGYLQAAGATEKKSEEIREYVEKVASYEGDFSKKSTLDKTAKSAPPKKVKKAPKGGHWVTIRGNHVFIEDK